MDSLMSDRRRPARRIGLIEDVVAAVLVVSAPILLTACTSMMPSHGPLGRYLPQDILLDNSLQTIAHEDLDRYTCHNGGALECVCESRLDTRCRCQCPFPVP